MRRILLRAILGVVAAAALIYAADYLSLRYRIPNNREQFGSVMVEESYAVPEKSGKTEYMFNPPAPQECVNSLFPHLGDPPCWYLDRHKRRQINTGDR